VVRVERVDASGGEICRQKMGATVRVTVVLTVRNEGAFLLEWLAHHRACGVTDFLVFSNDCDDGTDAMLDRLDALGWLTHVRNPGPHPEGPQWAALKLADTHPLVTGADWLRVNLAATAAGVAFQPLSQALQEYPEMAALYRDLHARLAPQGGTVQMLARIGHGPEVAPSPRWPLEAKILDA